jgi:hypothetical protein
MTAPRVFLDPIVVRRRNELADLYHDWSGDGDPDDDPEFVDAAREVMGLPPLEDIDGSHIVARADYDDEPDEDDPGEPDEEMRARAQSRMDDIDDEDDEPEDGYDAYRAAGVDTHPGGERLHLYWTKGAGLRRWAGSPHPWTALYRHLTKHVGAARAKRMASAWFHEVFGIWSGERKGDNPVGPG